MVAPCRAASLTNEPNSTLRRALATTLAPDNANVIAADRPMPELAPHLLGERLGKMPSIITSDNLRNSGNEKLMTILVVGASGATGRLLVQQLLERGHYVKIVVRSTENLPEEITAHKNVSVIHASILDLDDAELSHHVSDCRAMASCLGHNLTFKGIFGNPRRLVTDTARRLCGAVKENAPKEPVRFVLMNTSGYVNRDLNESISFLQTCVIWLLRVLLPPHVDNEKAADFLRTEVGQNGPVIEWAAVRPDSLIDDSGAIEYTVHHSPNRSAIFDAGLTSRINVAHFMAELITNDDTWLEWKGKMPVIYNKDLEVVHKEST